MRVVRLRLCVGQSGGDFMEEYTIALFRFFNLFKDFVQVLVQFPLYWVMAGSLCCYAVVCLCWSLILDD